MDPKKELLLRNPLGQSYDGGLLIIYSQLDLFLGLGYFYSTS